MWIFTKYGFYSAVCARRGDGSHGQPVDTDRIMIRVRLRSHLSALRERFPAIVGESEIQETVGTDYPFRLIVPKSVWVRVLAELADETTYDNFKSEVDRHQGQAGAVYTHSLHGVWTVMSKLQSIADADPITAEQMDSILSYLGRFAQADFSAGNWVTPHGFIPAFSYSPVVLEFHQALYDNHWVIPSFDWTNWQQVAQEYVDSPKTVDRADASTVRKLFTTHVRADRFCEGHFAAMIENGHIVTLLRRLETIRQKMSV